MNSESISPVHKIVKHPKPISVHQTGGRSMKHEITDKQRKELEAKMSKVFKKNIKELSTELQKILLDDLVTAFQNRINVLMRANKKRSY
jgi:predicted nucleotide-binding protein (sugar kinase/HSP70/actin superfamily)